MSASVISIDTGRQRRTAIHSDRQMVESIARDVDDALTLIIGYADWLLNVPGNANVREDIGRIKSVATLAASAVRHLEDAGERSPARVEVWPTLSRRADG